MKNALHYLDTIGIHASNFGYDVDCNSDGPTTYYQEVLAGPITPLSTETQDQ